ncbi:MAG: hypothetical protein MJ239_05790 [Bacilli bacterium]|nr:hypothetical protein [Bacilli bacterium]
MTKADKLVRVVSIMGVIVVALCAITCVFSMIASDFNNLISTSSTSSSGTTSVGEAIGGAIATGCANVIVAGVFIAIFGLGFVAYAVCFILGLVSLIRAHTAKKQVKSPAIMDLVISIIAAAASVVLIGVSLELGTMSIVLAVVRVVLCIALMVLSIVALAKSKKTVVRE